MPVELPQLGPQIGTASSRDEWFSDIERAALEFRFQLREINMKKWLAIVLICGLAAISGIATGLRAQDDTPKEEPAAGAESDPAAKPAEPVAVAPTTVPPKPYVADAALDPTKFPDATGGNSGVWTTPSATSVKKADGTDAVVGDGDPAALTIPDLYDRVYHNLISINIIWTMIAGFLVMFMQAGFMMVETGLCRAKNASHTSAMNLMVYPLGCLVLDLRICDRLGKLVERPGSPRLVSVAR